MKADVNLLVIRMYYAFSLYKVVVSFASVDWLQATGSVTT